MEPLDALSPLDGRYQATAAPLAAYFSEAALIRARIRVECAYLAALGAELGFTVPEIGEPDLVRIKEIEKTTNHDVKAVEYYLREKFPEHEQWIHFALTSEDVNSVAYALMLRGAVEKVIAPALQKIVDELDRISIAHAGVPMLARTHGQAASPTTFGHEMRVFETRLARQLDTLTALPILVKFGGATGNWSAHQTAFPKVDWIAFSKKFVDQFGLTLNQATTQIEPHDTYAEFFDTLRRANTILLDFSQDMWRYISDGWITQRPKEGEVGSSTMPHKVNPIDFENAEGNLGLANALLEFFSRKLPVSRLQRDLSDSTVERAFGEAFGHSLVAYESLLKGLSKISVNDQAMLDAVNVHPEVLAEPIQTILRRENVSNAYELLKNLTRPSGARAGGEAITMESLHTFIAMLPVSDVVKGELKKLKPAEYTGLASKIAKGF